MSSSHGSPMGGGGSGVGAPPVAFKAVLAKLGDGQWRTIDFDVTPLNAGTLLKALKHDEAFEVELRDVPLSRCAVSMLASASDEGPTAVEEESGATELKGARTLGVLAGGMLTVARPYLCIRVALPASGECTRRAGRVVRAVICPGQQPSKCQDVPRALPKLTLLVCELKRVLFSVQSWPRPRRPLVWMPLVCPPGCLI